MSKPHVLIVDDEPNILLSVRFLLEQAGYRVSQAERGIQALEIAQQDPPGIAVLDVMMPGMDGFQLAQELRANPQLKNLSIIFLTARGAVQDKIDGYQSGGELYLTKPFDNDELVSSIEELYTYG